MTHHGVSKATRFGLTPRDIACVMLLPVIVVLAWQFMVALTFWLWRHTALACAPDVESAVKKQLFVPVCEC